MSLNSVFPHLADEGYVITVPGRGTYVADKLPE